LPWWTSRNLADQLFSDRESCSPGLHSFVSLCCISSAPVTSTLSSLHPWIRLLGLDQQQGRQVARQQIMLPSVPFRPQSRRERHESSALDAHSPLDSGYGSASPPPSAPKDSAKENRPLLVDFQNHYDGNQSDSDDPAAGSDQENLVADVAAASLNSPSTSRPRHHLCRRSATLPLRTPRPRPSFPSPFRPFPNARLQQGRSNTTPLRHLDRFIPARHWGTTPSERFRVGKAPQELTTAERLVRHNGATEDAFVYRRRIVTPLGPESRSRSRAETAASRNEGQSSMGRPSRHDTDSA
jgi:hypothetical protein